MQTEIKINIYRDNGSWFGARWIGGEYDGCDALDVGAEADEGEARSVAYSDGLRLGREHGTPCSVVIDRVDDSSADG